MHADCLDLGVPPPTTACFTCGVWRPKVPGSPTRYIQRNFLSKVSRFWADVASTEMLVGEYVINRKRITFFPVPWHWIKIPDCTGCRWEGFIRRRASFCGRRSGLASSRWLCSRPITGHSRALQPNWWHFCENILKARKYWWGKQQNEAAEKGGMNKNNDKQQREHHS